jgi:hypothetical protein
MLAGRRSDVDDLNRRARTRLEPTGQLHGPTLLSDGVPFQAGDVVMTLRNDRRLGVRNGGRGTITTVDTDAHAVAIAFTTGERAVLSADYLAAGHLTHAYAMTVHKAQGLTCARAFTLGSDTLYREQGYVAMSRGRLGNHLYVVGPRPLDPDSAAHAPTRDRSPQELLAAGLATSKAQTLAVDYLADPSLLTWRLGDLFAEQRRLRLILAEAPEDRTRDIDSLTRTHDALIEDLRNLDCRHAELTDRHRTWRDRRRGPDPEQLLVEAKQSDARQRLAKLGSDLNAAYGSNLARRAFLAEHAPAVRRLDHIADVLDDRVDRAVRRAINEPRSYLTRMLGPLPTDGEPVGAWIDGATLIETYRLEHGILDGSGALGMEPSDPTTRRVWRQVLEEVQELVISSDAVRDISEVEHDLDLDL